MDDNLDRIVRKIQGLKVDLRESMKRVPWEKLKVWSECSRSIHLDYVRPRIWEFVRQKSSKHPLKPNASMTAAAKVIDRRLFLQFAQRKPCCRLMSSTSLKTRSWLLMEMRWLNQQTLARRK